MNGFYFLTIFAKRSILDVWRDSEFASEASNDLRKKLHLKQYSIVHGQIHVTLCSTLFAEYQKL